MKNVLTIVHVVLFFFLMSVWCFAEDNKYIDATLCFDYGMNMNINSSSSNYTYTYPTSGKGILLQYAVGGKAPDKWTVLNHNFGKLGGLLEYHYVFDKKGDLHSIIGGLEIKAFWIFKAQLGFGKEWAENKYDDYRGNKYKFNKLCAFFSIGAEIHLYKEISLYGAYREEGYDGGWPLEIGPPSLNRDIMIFGVMYSFL